MPEMKNLTIEEAVEFYYENGYVVIPNFLAEDEVEQLTNATEQLLDDLDLVKENPKPHAYHKLKGSDYQINSMDKISYFFESKAFDDKDNLILPKQEAVHQIAHAVHLKDKTCKSITFSKKFQDLVKALGFVKPKVIQSMMLLKQPNIGGAAPPHQDETYITTNPTGGVLGLWLPLDDATTSNGCLHFIPGSHKTEPLTKFYRQTGSKGTLGRMGYVGVANYEINPQDYQDKFVAVPAPKGSCVLIHGLVIHKSEPNTSTKKRRVYSFHLIETHEKKYSEFCQFQENENYKFRELY